MKNVIIKILAVLLTVWYSMSVIGFDVHTCSDSGRSFVVTFAKGLACEDIHPDHACDEVSCCGGHHDGCCSEHDSEHSACPFCEGVSIAAKSCCSNDYQALAITGTVSLQGHGHFDECTCGLYPCVGLSVCEAPALYENESIAYFRCPDFGVGSACERQAALRVWRI